MPVAPTDDPNQRNHRNSSPSRWSWSRIPMDLRLLVLAAAFATVLATVGWVVMDHRGSVQPPPSTSSTDTTPPTVPSPTTPPTSDPSSTPPCPTPPSLANSQAVHDLPTVVGNVVAGHIAYNHPGSMRQGRSYEIEAAIAKGTADCLIRQIRALGKVETRDIDVATKMVLTLKVPKDYPDAFDVRPLNNDSEQVILDDHPAHWAWQITPRRWGTYNLQLVCDVHLVIPGAADGAIDGTAIPVPLHVTPNMAYTGKTFLSDHWIWNMVVGGITLPTFVAWVWRRIPKRWKAKPKPPPVTDNEPAQAPGRGVAEAVVEASHQMWCPRCDEVQKGRPGDRCTNCAPPLLPVPIEQPDLAIPSSATHPTPRMRAPTDQRRRGNGERPS